MCLQLQPNPWTCLATSFAMVLDRPVQDVFDWCGHNGSRPLWKTLEDERFNHAGHHIQELIDYAYVLGYSVTPIDVNPAYVHFIKTDEHPHLWSEEHCMGRFTRYLENNNGIIAGKIGFNYGHAVAYIDHKIYDPRGHIIEDINTLEMGIETFYIINAHCE